MKKHHRPLSRLCFLNITRQTSFRNFCREFVNLPDSEGHTPLHSVINRCILEEECSKCIETLLANGANPYLIDDSGTIALELLKSRNATAKYANDSARYKQLIRKTSKVISSVMFFLLVLTISLSFFFISVMGNVKQNALELSNITLIQVIRDINIIVFTLVVGFWILSITFNMRYSDLRRRCLYLFIILIILGCVFLILCGAFVISQIIFNFFYAMLFTVFF